MSHPTRYRLVANSQLTAQETSNNQYSATSDTLDVCVTELLSSGRFGIPSLVVSRKKAFWVYRDLLTARAFKVSVNSQSGLVDVFIHRELVDAWTDNNRADSCHADYLDFVEYFRSLAAAKSYSRHEQPLR